jgi:hypothetical protein
MSAGLIRKSNYWRGVGLGGGERRATIVERAGGKERQ